ncbi:hypothetical protein BDY21DRAFT_18756 [Lineolata rhizophorae]|uniref:F-box domain-containing protein n=1 Tax=Lineolata rhizophorae TaxID=578093 RepID=A0A6A6P237_9PEZI|nr:hypothetical protein BDY21DRAFT_18756 [Lineolata rhizophorae]
MDFPSSGPWAARHRVLNTVELLENILLFLPDADLLFARKVCAHWRDVSEQSPRIRNALFLQSHNGSGPSPPRSDDAKPANPVGGKPPFGLGYDVNMLLKQRFEIGWDLTLHGEVLWVCPTPDKREHILEEREQSSWRRMLLAQPPHPFRYKHRSEALNVDIYFDGETALGDAVERIDMIDREEKRKQGFWRSQLCNAARRRGTGTYLVPATQLTRVEGT